MGEKDGFLWSGDHKYPLRNGVPNFLKYSSVETNDDLTRLQRLNELANSIGCVEALKRVHGADSGFTRYVTDESRCAFLELLPITNSSRILEIGSGLGQFTPLIAQRSAYVAAMEVVEEQAIFTLKRCVEAGCRNVTVATAGDTCLLPFNNDVFDGVILNLVLEWCGMREEKESREFSQRKLLRETHRVVKSGGFVFVATKNRYALGYLLGRRDGHAHKIRFGNALPRWLMSILLKRRGKVQPIGLLHSHTAFIRMIRESGFKKIEPYWAVPEMRHPERYISANAQAIRSARRGGPFKQGEGRILSRIYSIIPASLVKYLAYGNVAIAYK